MTAAIGNRWEAGNRESGMVCCRAVPPHLNPIPGGKRKSFLRAASAYAPQSRRISRAAVVANSPAFPIPGSRFPIPGFIDSRVSLPASRLHRGFTLIEVLVALLLLSLLLAGAWGGIHTATKAIHSGDLAIERMNRLRVTEQFLRRQLSHAMPLAFGRDDATGKNDLFEGESNRMRFVAPMPGYLSKGGAYVQTLELSRAAQGMQLTFADQMLNGFDLDDAEHDTTEPTLLIDGIAEGHFQYRGLDDQGELDDWTDEWDDSSRLPVMVRIAFQMSTDSGMTWPTMDIPLMMDVGSLPRRARSRPVPGMQQNGRVRAQPPRGPPAPEDQQ